MKLKAEIELGKRTAAIPKATNQHDVLVYTADKQTKLKEIGVSRQNASVFERMAKHEDYVDQYIDRKLALNQTPTRQLRRHLPDCVDALGKLFRALDGVSAYAKFVCDVLRGVANWPILGLLESAVFRSFARYVSDRFLPGLEHLPNAIRPVLIAQISPSKLFGVHPIVSDRTTENDHDRIYSRLLKDTFYSDFKLSREMFVLFGRLGRSSKKTVVFQWFEGATESILLGRPSVVGRRN